MIMKPWMKSSFDQYEDSDEDSDSDFEYPKLLVDDQGRKKFIMNQAEEKKFQLTFWGVGAHTDVDVRSRDNLSPKNHPTANHLYDQGSLGKKTTVELTLAETPAKKKRRTHGLAPFRMTVPLAGKAYVMGTGNNVKTPLAESGLEAYNRLQKVKVRKTARENKRYIQCLKKTGKVGTLVPFMFDT